MPGHADPDSYLPALPTAPPRPPFVPERADFLEDDTPAADRQGRSLPGPRPGVSRRRIGRGGALVFWICDTLVSNYTVKAYGHDFKITTSRIPIGIVPNRKILT